MSMGSGGDCSWCRWVMVKIVRGVDGQWRRLFAVSMGVVKIVRGIDG